MLCLLQMRTGAMWTSQILVKTKPHPKQGLVGSGPVRRVIPMGKKSLESMEPESSESTESESSEKNGKTGNSALTCFDKHFINGQVKKHYQRWLQVQRKPEPHNQQGRVQVPG